MYPVTVLNVVDDEPVASIPWTNLSLNVILSSPITRSLKASSLVPLLVSIISLSLLRISVPTSISEILMISSSMAI